MERSATRGLSSGFYEAEVTEEMVECREGRWGERFKGSVGGTDERRRGVRGWGCYIDQKQKDNQLRKKGVWLFVVHRKVDREGKRIKKKKVFMFFLLIVHDQKMIECV
ncbi:unnamed protein product [Lactuca virosa]|uniref:Uncharacterized protein n=1 Tax=Lactuca virosa TaxID=75947 RepID=A0AAU9NX52_9ASTR|nr:unnamed protein product [Lactuca virosa]